MKPTENSRVENHPLEPFLPENAEVVILGSFPPKEERWRMRFYYPNFQNDMWRIFGIVFFDDKEHFLIPDRQTFDEAKIRTFLTLKGIAMSDTAKSVTRHKDNASDKFLEIVEPNPPSFFLQRLPQLKTFVTTGQKATDTLLSFTDAQQPNVGGFTEFTLNNQLLQLYRMPSSSRAYPMALDKKAAFYKAMFEELRYL